MSNEAEMQDEVDVIELLAVKGEEEIDEVSEIDVDTDDIEVLKERIAKRNKALKKSKQANHRIQDEKSALEKRIDDLEKSLTSPAPNEEAQRQEQQKVLAEWKESVADDPSKALDYFNYQMKSMQDNFAEILANQQSAFADQIGAIRGDIDPEKNKYRDKIEALKSNPELAEIPDEFLLKMAKQMEERVPRGAIGGKRAIQQADPKKDLEAIKDRYRKQFSNGL